MSSIAALIGTVCVISIVVSLLGIISPNGMTEKTLNLVIGVFIICAMLAPVKSFFADFSFKLNFEQKSEAISSNAQQAYNKAVIDECRSRLESSLVSNLRDDDYNVNKVEIKLDKKEDGGIYVSCIYIYIDKTETRIQKIIRCTEQEFKITPRVIVNDD